MKISFGPLDQAQTIHMNSSNLIQWSKRIINMKTYKRPLYKLKKQENPSRIQIPWSVTLMETFYEVFLTCHCINVDDFESLDRRNNGPFNCQHDIHCNN